MKKILVLFAAAIFAASCMGIGGYETEYPVVVSFDYTESDFLESSARPDSLLYDTEYKAGFVWDRLAFMHKIDEYTMAPTGGFLVSFLKVPVNCEVQGSYDQYRANATNKRSSFHKYGVFYQGMEMPQYHLLFTGESNSTTVSTCTMSHMYVTNSVATERAVRGSFEDGDKMVLKATGYKGGEVTGSAQISLAEYTEKKDSVVTEWTKFDLSALGSVDNVKFEIQFLTNKYIPSTVCVDDITARIAISQK